MEIVSKKPFSTDFDCENGNFTTPSCCPLAPNPSAWTHGERVYLNDNGNFFNGTSGECFIGRKVIRNYWPASYGHSVSPFRQRNPLSWHKILLDILFNTIFLLTWEDVCEGGRSVVRLLNPHEHKRTSNVFQSDVIFIFCLSYLHWQRSRGEVVVQIGWDFSTCGPRSMFNQFFTLLSRPGKAEWTICLFKMLRCGDFFLSHSQFILGRGRYLLKVGMEFKLEQVGSIECGAGVEIKSFSINWHQLVPGPHSFAFNLRPKSHTHMELTNNNKNVSINLNWNWSTTEKTSLSHSRKFYGNLWTIFLGIQPDFCVICVSIEVFSIKKKEKLKLQRSAHWIRDLWQREAVS